MREIGRWLARGCLDWHGLSTKTREGEDSEVLRGVTLFDKGLSTMVGISKVSEVLR